MCVNIPFTSNKRLSTVGCLVSHESWHIMIPARALFNYLFSFCPIDLHCEPFNYTIHHFLNMKNGVKHMLIKPCRKAFCKGPLNQTNGPCAWRVYVCRYVCLLFRCFFFHFLAISSTSSSAVSQRRFTVFGGRCHEFTLMPSSAEAFVCFAFVPGHNETNLIGRACLILIQYQQGRRTDKWKSSQIIEVN